MLDILPRFPDPAIRIRVNHIIPFGTEVVVLHPQGIYSSRRHPRHRYKEIPEADLTSKRWNSTSLALLEITCNVVRQWMNEDPILWCQYGAKFKVNKIATTYTITLYPYPII